MTKPVRIRRPALGRWPAAGQRPTLVLAMGTLALAGVFAAGVAVGQNKYGTPKTIVHLVAIKWKAESTEADRQKAIDGVKTMAAAIPGIKNVWTKTIRVQPQGYNATFALEFEDQAAADRYRDHPAHKEWETHYLSIREESRSHQTTN